MRKSSIATLRALSCGLSLLAASPAFADDSASAVAGACRALADSRVLSAALIGTLFADAQSFERVQASIAALDRDVRPDLDAPASAMASRRVLAGMGAQAEVLRQQRDVVQKGHERLRAVSHAGNDLLEASEALDSLMLQNNASAAHIAAVMQLAVPSQRLGRSADTVFTWNGIDPEAVLLLGKDLKTFDMLLSGLVNGNTELRLHAQRQPDIVKQLARAQAILAGMRGDGQYFFGHVHELMAAREAQAALQHEADPLGHVLAMSCAGSDAGVSEPLRLPGQAASASAAKR